MPIDIYSNFLNKLHKYSIYRVPFKFQETDQLIDILADKYAEIIAIGHSSGCSTLIHSVRNKRALKRCVFLDPVDTRIVKGVEWAPKLPHVDDILYINAMKSYDGNPISFIPQYFKLGEINGCKTRTIEFADYGHCDILNPVYSNFMYKSGICDGTGKRMKAELANYHELVAQHIDEFIGTD